MGNDELTLEYLETKCSLRHTAHLDGPRNGDDAWFGDMHECVQEPRLQRRVRYWRATRTQDVTWFVDGVEVGSDLAAVIPLLRQPPTLTDEEHAVLLMVTAEWQDLRNRDITSTLLSLRSKGMVEFDTGRCRRIRA